MPAAAEPAGALHYRTDVSPEDLFLAIGTLRREARDEVDRLLQFLDKTDDYVCRELEDDSGENEEGGDAEPCLGSLDRVANQERWSKGAHAWGASDGDRELDRSDDEPALGSLENQSQERWAAGGRRDLERDPAESGIADLKGLYEQGAETQDWQQGAMA